MRSVLTVPVIVPRFVEKAPSSGADVICLDIRTPCLPGGEGAGPWVGG
jgi:hypothetical protein